MPDSHLTPVQREDKNGVVNTKWVRNSPETSASASKIPSPALPSGIDRMQRVTTAAMSMSLNSTSKDRRLVENLSDQTLAEIATLAAAGRRLEPLRWALEKNEPESFLIDYINLVEVLDPQSKSQYDTFTAQIRSLDDYPYIAPATPGEEYPELRRVQASAILRVSDMLDMFAIDGDIPSGVIKQRYLKGDSVNSIYIADEPLARYIVDNADNAEQILGVIHERKTADLSLITSILDSDTKAISEGIL